MEGLRRNMVDILLLGRLQFLLGGLLLYVMGVMVAVEMGYLPDVSRAISGYFVFVPAHLSVSYSNDIYDMDADSFNPKSLFTGGSGVLERRPELRDAAHLISIILILISITGSIVFTIHYSIHPVYILIVIAGSLLGWFYTAPPIKLSYRGLGEVSTAVTVGILVPLFGFFTMAGTLHLDLILFLFPMLLSGLAFIMIVQVPDMEADILGGKNTWVMKMGRENTFILLFLSILMQSLYYGAMFLMDVSVGDISFLPFFLVSLIPLLMAIPGIIMRPVLRKEATRLVTVNMLALFLYLAFLDVVLIFFF